jgi:hypothetical protein
MDAGPIITSESVAIDDRIKVFNNIYAVKVILLISSSGSKICFFSRHLNYFSYFLKKVTIAHYFFICKANKGEKVLGAYFP